jgi:hypothetical protein
MNRKEKGVKQEYGFYLDTLILRYSDIGYCDIVILVAENIPISYYYPAINPKL